MKKTKMYMVAWHEENEAGLPMHVMGVEAFYTREDAEAWIDKSVKEDLDRHAHQRHPVSAFLDETVDDGIVHTYGNGQHCVYCVQEIEVEDPLQGLLDELHAVFKKPSLNSTEKCAMISSSVYDFEKKYRPKKKFRVDVSFRPTICVHDVEAADEAEAESIVEQMIDDRTLRVNANDVMDNLLENVESIDNAEEDT